MDTKILGFTSCSGDHHLQLKLLICHCVYSIYGLYVHLNLCRRYNITSDDVPLKFDASDNDK